MESLSVVLDACVLVPAVSTDTLLRLAERGLYRPHWSELILAETRWALLEIHDGMEDEQIDRRFNHMNLAFEDALVTDWESLEGVVVLPDPDDRHIVAAAMKCGADAIVTANVDDFPYDELNRFGIGVQSLDDFLLDLLDLAPEMVVAAISEQARDTRRPHLTSDEVLNGLRRVGAPDFAVLVEQLLSPKDHNS
ncbi:MAG: PIN domain-containing protein [Microthrixaceae bacterium]